MINGWLPVEETDSEHPLIYLLQFDEPRPFSDDMQKKLAMRKDVAALKLQLGREGKKCLAPSCRYLQRNDGN